jgi:hypothetical protein
MECGRYVHCSTVLARRGCMHNVIVTFVQNIGLRGGWTGGRQGRATRKESKDGHREVVSVNRTVLANWLVFASQAESPHDGGLHGPCNGSTLDGSIWTVERVRVRKCWERFKLLAY